MVVEFTPPRRDQLATIAGDDEALIRVLEDLFRIAGQGTPSQVVENTANIATNTADIADNAVDIATNAAGIAANAGNIATNASNIATNAADILLRLVASNNLSDLADVSTSRANLGLDAFNSNLILVTEKADFPAPVSGVITLSAGATYFILGDIDLTGDRLEAGGIVTILGTSSETASITSTGLGASTPLLTSRYTMPVRFVTFKDVGTGIYIDDNAGANAPLAIDWLGVNFNNVTTVGEIGTIDNFVYDTGAFLEAQGLSFTGTVGTAAFSNSLFAGDGSAANIIEIASTATFTRRFRIIYSSVVAFSSTVGLNVNVSATIPVEGYILDTVNFSGGGTYIIGVQFDDNKSRWDNNRGVTNSAAISNYFMNGNATATTISAIGTEVKVAGTTTSSAITQRFTNTDNRATYDGVIQRDFKVSAVFSVESGNNNEVGAYIAKNGTTIAASEIYVTTNAGGRAEAGFCQTIIDLNQNDYIEIFVENNTSTSDITATELNVIVEAIN